MAQTGGHDVKASCCGAGMVFDGEFGLTYCREKSITFCPYRGFDFCEYTKKVIDTSKECAECFFNTKSED